MTNPPRLAEYMKVDYHNQCTDSDGQSIPRPTPGETPGIPGDTNHANV